MANLTNIPAIDWFETTLASSWNGTVWTVSVLDVPSWTIESGETSYIVVNPWKSNMQVAKIDGWDSWTKTFNVTDISVEKWNGVDYTAQSHAANSVVRFSNNYAFWKDIRTAVNSKAWTDTSNTWTWTQTFDKVITTGYTKDAIYADDTARDTAIPSPSNWMRVYNTAVWLFQKYQAGAWIDDTSWASTPNASTTVAGKVEKATQPETNAWTSIGGTGAELFVWPAELVSFAAWITVPDATDTVKGKVELATNAEAVTWTDTTRAVTPAWLAAAIAGSYDYTTTIQWYTEASVIWTSANTGLTITATDIFLSNMMKIQPTGASGYAYNKLYTPKPTTTLANSLNWTNISIIELEFQALLPQQTAGQSAMIGIGTAATDYTNVATTTDSLVLAHTGNTNDVYLKSADWTTASNSSVATSTQAWFRKYKIVYTKWVSAILYIDWVSVITKTTNLPDSWDIFIWAGKQETGIMYVSPITVKIKYT